ncbi:MAG: M20 family metallo-hydrolase [Candidatus Micrarchaeales archaeon]|jgi:succinyl-diaminopimelate desuccinylase|uniref:Acetylornithine deacetylase or succinyl-diaminopimelate desuccinylase n=1 Tax=Candidatus Micrarchaeum acidiphilum ARMAN-2 TaxID=425595 RepID=C7DH05_MICA2|nr:MAG: acetylornithine deacetylase or succinyl-diaminopimelate desuccinylase [Candidatus Micrarchaeum acidiphilum ARMAN-2]MCW6161437.1 M20 family metallo-hydrolase [Candidatus Micrarchaeales archaeon]
MTTTRKNIGELLDTKEMVDTLSKMIAIKAISPKSGGAGEMERAQFLRSILERWGFEVKEYDYTDSDGVKRPNLVVKYGDNDRTLWLVPHMDTVAAGDLEAWKTDPFTATIRDGKIYGRGSMDDGQSLVSALYALRALKDSGSNPPINFGLAIVADEELGSVYGIEKLVEEKGLFSSSDMFMVPDWSTSDGSKVEVAEKSVLWLKFTFEGKQVHASTPDDGVNALRVAIKFFYRLDNLLHEKYSARDPIFEPSVSTFEMTKHEKNVDSVNIVPGKEVFYLDSRILPCYDINQVLRDIEEFSKSPEFSPAKITIDIEEKNAAPQATPVSAEIVKLLRGTVKEYRGFELKPVGIGGGTCATFFRRKGFPTAVWFTGDDVAHQPNEYASIENMVNDAKVFLGLFRQK